MKFNAILPGVAGFIFLFADLVGLAERFDLFLLDKEIQQPGTQLLIHDVILKGSVVQCSLMEFIRQGVAHIILDKERDSLLSLNRYVLLAAFVAPGGSRIQSGAEFLLQLSFDSFAVIVDEFLGRRTRHLLVLVLLGLLSPFIGRGATLRWSCCHFQLFNCN